MLLPRCRFAGPGCTVALLSLLTTGCGSGTATVAGTVTYQGKPVTGGSVVVYCADKQIARGLIGRDGKYTIPNAPCGPAVVTVQAHSRVPPGLQLPQKLPPTVHGPAFPAADPAGADRGALVPVRYAMPEESGLSLVVKGERLTYDIDLMP